MKNILIGVTGGIAAYKVPNIVSALKKSGFNIKVIMTENATKIITPLAFEVLSKNDVVTDMWENGKNKDVEHISLGKWADILLVVPATYNIVGKVAGGIADDILSTVISAFTKPVYFALAMNENMYNNPILHENRRRLEKYGYNFIEADEGFLACNVNAVGRLKNEQEIADIITKRLSSDEVTSKKLSPLNGKKVLITAGRTEEPLDPIRYFSNRSTGKMGYSLAQIAASSGARVTLASGPTNLAPPKNVNTLKVQTAEEMYNKVMEHEGEQDIIIAAAAVADYRPEKIYDKKIKKGENFSINFVRNKDILLELGNLKSNKPNNNSILIGFAAESENLIENAQKKLQKKNLDMIIANSVNNFATDDNEVTIIGKNFTEKIDRGDKKVVAEKIWEIIVEKLL